MPTSNFKLFDENKANMLSDQEYETNNQRLNGVQQGIASSQLQNKTMYQVALMTYAIAQLMVQNGVDASDQAAVSAFVDNLNKTLVQKVKDKASEQDLLGFNDRDKYVSPGVFTAAAASEDEVIAGISDKKYVTPVALWKAIAAFNSKNLILKQVFTSNGTYTPTIGKVKCVIVAVGFGGDGGDALPNKGEFGTLFSATGGGGGGATVITQEIVISGLPSNKSIVIDRNSKTVNVFGGYIIAKAGGNGEKSKKEETSIKTGRVKGGAGGSGSTKPTGAVEIKGGNGGDGGSSVDNSTSATLTDIEQVSGTDGENANKVESGSVSIYLGAGGGGGCGDAYVRPELTTAMYKVIRSGRGGSCGSNEGGNSYSYVINKAGYNIVGASGGSGATYNAAGANGEGEQSYGEPVKARDVSNLIGAGAGGNGGSSSTNVGAEVVVKGAKGGTGAVFIYENA